MGSNIECCRHSPDGSDMHLSRRNVLTLAAQDSHIHATRVLGRRPGRAAYLGHDAGPLQAGEFDYRKRAAIPRRMQRLVRERARYVSTRQARFVGGTDPRVGQSGFRPIPGFVYTAPYEEPKLKSA